jgi:flagellar motility protein MotE (MotC chaperone)
MRRFLLTVLTTMVFTALIMKLSPLLAAAEGGHGGEEKAAKAEGHGEGHGKGKAKEPEKPKIDPSKYQFFPSPQSLEDLRDDAPETSGLPDATDKNVKIVYRTPESCKEFSIYMQEKQRKLTDLENEIHQKEEVLAKLKQEFETVTLKFSDVEGRIKKLMQRDPTNLQDNPQLATMIKLYESLPAEDAAARLRNLDLDLTLALLKGMKPKKLSLILLAMEPKLAAAISSQIVRGF